VRWLYDAPSDPENTAYTGPGIGYCEKACGLGKGGNYRLCEQCPGRQMQPLPENAAAMDLFSRLGGSWNRDMGQPTGLNMPNVQVIAEGHGLTLDADLLDKLQIMERAVLRVAEEKRQQGQEGHEHD